MPMTIEYFSSHATIADAQASPIVVVLSSAEMQKLISADAERYVQIARRAGISIE